MSSQLIMRKVEMLALPVFSKVSNADNNSFSQDLKCWHCQCFSSHILLLFFLWNEIFWKWCHMLIFIFLNTAEKKSGGTNPYVYPKAFCSRWYRDYYQNFIVLKYKYGGVACDTAIALSDSRLFHFLTLQEFHCFPSKFSLSSCTESLNILEYQFNSFYVEIVFWNSIILNLTN